MRDSRFKVLTLTVSFVLVGKTSLMSYVASRCMQNLRPSDNFVFVHIVDSCLGSNILLNMLLQLHENLCNYIGTKNHLKTMIDLKASHVTQLEETARNNPKKKFELTNLLCQTNTDCTKLLCLILFSKHNFCF